MRIQEINSVVLAVVIAVGLVACGEHDAAEKAGRELDQFADKAENRLDHAGKEMDAQTGKAGVSLEDAAITAKIKAAILAEPGLRSIDINVDTVDGVATLEGKVDTQVNIDKAEKIAAAVSDVKQVKNRLYVKLPN